MDWNDNLSIEHMYICKAKETNVNYFPKERYGKARKKNIYKTFSNARRQAVVSPQDETEWCLKGFLTKR